MCAMVIDSPVSIIESKDVEPSPLMFNVQLAAESDVKFQTACVRTS